MNYVPEYGLAKWTRIIVHMNMTVRTWDKRIYIVATSPNCSHGHAIGIVP